MKTKTTQHTPGPWKVSVPIRGDKYAVWTRNHSDFEGPKVVVSRELNEADAKLIAAAPEMIAMLKHLVSLDHDDIDNLESIKESARELIAKTEAK